MMSRIFTVVLIVISINFSFADTFRIDCRNSAPVLFPTSHGCLGPVAELVEVALLNQGHKVSWGSQKWDESLGKAKKGDVDMLIHHSISVDSDNFLFETAYGYEIEDVSYFVSAGESGQIQSKTDLDGLVIGAIQDKFYSLEFSKNTNIVKKFYSNVEEIKQAFQIGDVDGVIAAKDDVYDKFKLLAGARISKYKESQFKGLYVSIPTKSKRIVHFSAFSGEIERMILAGEIREIFEKHQLDPPFQIVKER